MISIVLIFTVGIIGFAITSQAEKYYKKTKKRINGVDSHLDSLHRHQQFKMNLLLVVTFTVKI